MPVLLSAQTERTITGLNPSTVYSVRVFALDKDSKASPPAVQTATTGWWRDGFLLLFVCLFVCL